MSKLNLYNFMMLSTYDTYNQFQNEVFITDIYNKNYIGKSF